MAGDSDLATATVAEAARHEAPTLLQWLKFFVRTRWVLPFLLVPGTYEVHLLLHTTYDLAALCWVAVATLVTNCVASLTARHLERAPELDRVALSRLVSAVTMGDVLLLVVGVHYAGGAIGPFWPFPFIPVIVGAAIVPSQRALALNFVVALGATAISASTHGVMASFAPVILSSLFLTFGALLVNAVSNDLRRQRMVSLELDRALGDRQVAESEARRREEILSVVSHELASPLMTLRGYVRLMQENKNRDRNAQLLDRVERQVQRISSLADDLLEMASTQAGAMRLKRRSFELVEALRELRENARVQHPDADIRLEATDSVTGTWDRDRLEQLVGNLVSNAVKFGGARSRVTIVVTKENLREVRVSVTDDGPGISKDALARIFEPFQRYSSERGGLGLGLAIARAVAELHQGRIWAESPSDPSGRGATIHVVLPTDSKPSDQQPIVGHLETTRAPD